jgi:cation-transporting ATPase E
MKKLNEVPFNSKRKWSAISFKNNQSYYLGAADILIKDSTLLDQVKALSQKGLRVLAFCQSKDTLDNESLPKDLEPLALLAIEDKIRDDIKETIASFNQYGISIKIISGDSHETVQAIAYVCGLKADEVITEDELNSLDQQSFSQKVLATNLFARITPDTKAKIVEALMKAGNHVAMIGDGVNDVPSLKRANLAIAINDGTQISKDVSDLVLLNNAFNTLPKAFEEGNLIRQRLYAVLKVFLTKAIYLAALFLFATLSLMAFPLTLIQTTYLSFIVVGVPTTLILFSLVVPVDTKNFKEATIYSLIWGIIAGASILLLTNIAKIIFVNSQTDTTLVSLFISLFQLLLLFDLHGLSLFKPKTLLAKPSITILFAILGLAIIPIYYLKPKLIDLILLPNTSWFILLIILLLSYGLAYYLSRKVSFKKN